MYEEERNKQTNTEHNKNNKNNDTKIKRVIATLKFQKVIP
jgi:hypothetical protein